MSGDATCRGIRSPRDGPVVMELSQGMHLLNSFQKALNKQTFKSLKNVFKVTDID